MTQKPKYRLRKIRLDEISIVDSPAEENSRVTIFKRGPMPSEDPAKIAAQLRAKAGPAPEDQPDDIAKRAADALAELTAAIAGVQGILHDNSDVLKAADPAGLSVADKACAALATQIGKANQAMRKAAQRREADALFSKAGLSNSLADLQAETAKAESFPARFQAHVDQTDLDTLRVEKAKADRPAHPVDRERRRVSDALDDEVRARQARTGEAYVVALDRILESRKRARGG